MNYYSLSLAFASLASASVPEAYQRWLSAPVADQKWMKKSLRNYRDFSADRSHVAHGSKSIPASDYFSEADKASCEKFYVKENVGFCGLANKCFFHDGQFSNDHCANVCDNIANNWVEDSCDNSHYQYYYNNGDEKVCSFDKQNQGECVSVNSNTVDYPIRAVAYLGVSGDYDSNGCHGIVNFVQADATSTTASYTLRNCFPEGPHGFHIHAEWNADAVGCVAKAGGHYNPHGVASDHEDYVTNMGLAITDSNGFASGAAVESILRLTGETSVVGRSVVIHEGPGGARIACGPVNGLDSLAAAHADAQQRLAGIAGMVAAKPSVCAGTPIQAEMDSFRDWALAESWCDWDCESFFDKADVFFKIIHDSTGPYGCNMAFNVELQDRITYWGANFADQYPQIMGRWAQFEASQWEDNWGPFSRDFRHWQSQDHIAKQFWEVSEALTALDSSTPSFMGAHDYWNARRLRFRKHFASRAYKHATNGYDMSTFDFLWMETMNASEESIWLSIFFQQSDGLQIIAAQAAADDGSAKCELSKEFIFRFFKVLDMVTISGNSALPAQFTQMTAVSEFLSNNWDDYEYGNSNSFDNSYKLACGKAVEAGFAALQYLSAAF